MRMTSAPSSMLTGIARYSGVPDQPAQEHRERAADDIRKGGRLSTSTGGQLTGRGGDIIIIDDPLKADEAHSETARKKCRGMGSNDPDVAFQQSSEKGRSYSSCNGWHVDDLAGVLLETGGWEHLNLPATAEQDERIPIDDGPMARAQGGRLAASRRASGRSNSGGCLSETSDRLPSPRSISSPLPRRTAISSSGTGSANTTRQRSILGQ